MRNKVPNAMPKARVVLGIALFACLGGASAGLAKEHQVVIEQMKFVPDHAEVRTGDTIVWINRDLVPHTVTGKSGFDSGAIESGQTFRLRVTQPGEVSYFCRFHPMMKGKLMVQGAR